MYNILYYTFLFLLYLNNTDKGITNLFECDKKIVTCLSCLS